MADNNRNGFALTIALVFLGFIFSLMICLSVLVQTQITATTNTQHLSHSRQNAIFGLQVAIGNLQKHLGPDQRISAYADILNENQFSPHLPAPNTKRWLGVWNTENYDATNPTPREFEAWLTSGREFPGGSPTTIDYVESFTTSADTIELIGSNTVKKSSDRVSVEKVELDSGGYAYWVGDESQKAKINPSTSWQRDLSTKQQEVIANLSPTRSGAPTVEALKALRDLDSPDYQIESLLERSFIKEHILLDPILASTGLSEEDLNEAYFSQTLFSRGLLTNVKDGGLKKNLFSYLNNHSSSTLKDDDELFELNSGTGPLYGRIKSWYELRDDFDAEGAIEIRPETDPTPAVTPLIIRFLWQVYGCYEGDWTSGNPTVAYRIVPRAWLWNPYNVPLSIPEGTTLDIELGSVQQLRYVLVEKPLEGGENRDSSIIEPLKTLRFRLTPIVIPPGKTLVFTPEASSAADGFAIRYDGGDWKVEGIENHTPGGTLQATDFNDAFHFILSTGEAIDVEGRNLDEMEVGVRQRTGNDIIALRLDDKDLFVLQTADLGITANPPRIFPLNHISSDTAHFPLQKHGKAVMFRNLEGNKQFPQRAVRLFANFNPRTPIINDPPLGLSFDASNGDLFFSNPNNYDYQFNQFFGNQTNPTTSWAIPVSLDNNGQGDRIALFEIPRGDYPMVSLGQLKHADFGQLPWEPAHPFANSLASPIVPRESTSGSFVSGHNSDDDFKDLSYRLNDALWDNYFLGEFDLEDLGEAQNVRSKNPILSTQTQDIDLLEDFDSSANYLYVDGAFNVNSTDVGAWAALLGSFNSVAPPGKPHLPGNTPHSYSRYLNPPLEAFDPENQPILSQNGLAGFRILTHDQLLDLAEKIVSEVKARGPFHSLSHFVNRSLVADTSAQAELGLMGALQAAIEKSNINNRYNEPPGITGLDDVWMLEASSHDRYLPEHVTGFTSNTSGNVIKQGSRGAFLPGYITQADILEKIGSQITVRGDTFVVRSYGSATNPLNSEVISESYLETILQRTTEPLENSGRRFKIVSFRWISEDDI
ncbi:hypothetical protein [Puniceicoccus vermicola]|uniref:Verru_Chthon cassette protein A n=1 Tax=Puniceicoccus vermicola TaxID=388746 RepID=A0A7X1B1X6_9BACT|nr:hypothetical protein [Puniceicoccus vermicola]MBC2603969.1 hypothetical protein [Puniceicoccus vermicola]